MPKATFIYALCEPGTRKVRYIGKSNNPDRRLRYEHLRYEHLLRADKRTTHLGCWLRRVIQSGKTPNLVILAEVSDRSWKTEECRYIAAARMLGLDLVNSTDGGDGVTMTPETRKKIGDKNRGRKRSLEYREQKSKDMTGCRLGEKHPMFGRVGPANPKFGTKKKGASSVFIGVFWHSSSGKWRARIGNKSFGAFKLEIDAAKAYDRAVRGLYGRKAKTNFPIKCRD